jgi:hypothetical protein
VTGVKNQGHCGKESLICMSPGLVIIDIILYWIGCNLLFLLMFRMQVVAGPFQPL